MRGNLIAYAICGACAFLWISAAFIVGFPGQMFALDWRDLAAEFIHNAHNETMLIPFLLFVDIVIAIWLDHLVISRAQFAMIAMAGVIYLLVTGLAPQYGDRHISAEHDANTHFWLFMVSLMCLAVTRFITLMPKPFVPLAPASVLPGTGHGEKGPKA